MPYPEQLVIPMRGDLTQYGVDETRTPAEVEAALAPGSGTVLLVINSVCGCAAGRARPAVGMALQHRLRPQRAATVFAGADVEALAYLRSTKLASVPPSSPSMALFRDGELKFVMHRSDIEKREAPEIAGILIDVFDEFCAPQPVSEAR